MLRLIDEQEEDITTADSFWMTSLHYAAQNGYKSLVRALIKRGANVEAENKFGKTPIYMANAMGHSDIAEMLKDAGATVHSPVLRSRP